MVAVTLVVWVLLRVVVGFAEADRELLNEGVKVFVAIVVCVPESVATDVPEFV